MAKRRERGEGSISRPDAEGFIEVRLSLGVVDGKRQRVKSRVRGKAEALAALQELKDTYSVGGAGPTSKTVREYLASWIARRKPSLADKTIRMYEGAIANLNPFLGHLKLRQLTADQIAAALRGLAEKKRTAEVDADGQALYGRKAGADGTRTVQQAYDTLRAALSFAVRKDAVLRSSPILAVARPRLDREIDFLTRDEAQKFLAAVSKDRYRALFHLVIATGLRWGEIAALRWSDVDLEAATLSVTRSLKETGKFGPTKSRGSRRRIDLPPSVVSELARHRKKKWTSDELIFRARNGNALNPSNFSFRYFFPALERAKLRRIRFHDLRHTAAAIRLLAGQHPLVVKELLGHSSIRTTLDVYGHLQASVSRDAAAAYDLAMQTKNK